ncbi:MAG: TIR domain-containing protein [Acidobacteria bacterium]|nr:TIR domain-containing protein [Acidobacteriota bacterium]
MKICLTCRRTHTDEIAFCPHDGTPLQQTVTSTAGQLLDDRYEIEALIAQTRTGDLYRARDVLLGRRMAVKMFRPELRGEIAVWRERYRDEWQAALNFSHPNAVTIYDLHPEYMLMDYAEGRTLDKELREHNRFTPREMCEALAPVAGALDAARAHGIACDFLTPADIMIGRTENNLPSVKLLPFIFNRRFAGHTRGDFSTTRELYMEAAAPYVAPELRRDGTATPEGGRGDVYSLGVISYELVCERKPYEGLTPREVEQTQLTGRHAALAELAPEMPARAARVVERALAKEGKNRHATAGEFMSELRDALGAGQRESTDSHVMASPDISYVRGLPTERGRRGSARTTESRRDVPQAAGASATDKPLYTDENVQFTVYQPEAVAPARWHMLLAFAHLSKRRPDAPPDEPEPLAEVKRMADRALADQTAEYDAVKQNSLHAVPHRSEVTFVPDVEGCEFNPSSQSFSWRKSVHKVEFEMRAAASLDGRMARGRLTVFLGSLILADIPLAIRVDSASVSPAREVPAVAASAAPYRKIFPSYSHKDRAVVEQIEHHIHALGDKYLRDLTELRAGQDWQRWMRDAIREADVFQLFWSHNSMRSAYVREEWEYALSLGRPNFVRPTYWETPLPESATENLPPAELRRLHFQHLRANNITYHPTPAISDPDDAEGHSQTRTPGLEHAAAVAEAQPGGGDVVCANCGARNPPGKAFCQTCAMSSSAPAPSRAQPMTAQSAPQSAATSVRESGGVLDIFWQKRPREHQPAETSSYRPYTFERASPVRAMKRLLLWIMLLSFVALAVYLLVRLL